MVKITDESQNLTRLRKVAESLAREGTDVEETFDCLKLAYWLGKAEGRLERTLERIEEINQHEQKVMLHG